MWMNMPNKDHRLQTKNTQLCTRPVSHSNQLESALDIFLAVTDLHFFGLITINCSLSIGFIMTRFINHSEQSTPKFANVISWY